MLLSDVARSLVISLPKKVLRMQLPAALDELNKTTCTNHPFTPHQSALPTTTSMALPAQRVLQAARLLKTPLPAVSGACCKESGHAWRGINAPSYY